MKAIKLTLFLKIKLVSTNFYLYQKLINVFNLEIRNKFSETYPNQQVLFFPKNENLSNQNAI